MTKPLFSICLIAKNEAKTLPLLLNSLESFKKHGGEVVLVDTGSTDKTAEIARNWGCVVEEVGTRFVKAISIKEYEEIDSKFRNKSDSGNIVTPGEFIFDFAEARNYCASLASNDMISMPDCDEIFTALDIYEINRDIRAGFTQLEFNFVFAHGPNGEETVKFIQCKFYDRRKMSWTGVIHEVLQGEGNRKLLSPAVLKIEHYQNVETNRDGYLKGLAYDCLKNPTNDRNSHYFARELMYRGFFASAIDEFKRHLTLSKWDAERAQSMIYIGDCLMHFGKTTEAIKQYLRAFLEYDGKREALLKLVRIYRERNDWRRTRFFAEGALKIKYSGFYADNLADYDDGYLYGILYACCYHLGDLEDARLYYDLAVQEHPDNKFLQSERKWFYPEESEAKVSILIPTLGRPEGLLRLYRSIWNLDYPSELLEIICEEDSQRIGVPKLLNRLFKQSTGEFVVFAANDTEFNPLAIREAVARAKKDNLDLVAFNTGEVGKDEGNICEHFLIRTDYVLMHLNGKIFDEDFHHVGVDNLLWATVKNKAREEKAIVYHYHFSKEDGKNDEIYELGWSKVNEDRELLKKKLKDLNN